MVDENVYIDICTYKTTIGCTNLNVPWLIAALNKYKKERFERMFSLYWKFVEFLYLPCFYLVFFFFYLNINFDLVPTRRLMARIDKGKKKKKVPI